MDLSFNMTGILIRRRKCHKENICDYREKDGSNAVTSQEIPRVDGHHRKLDRRKEEFHHSLRGYMTPLTPLIYSF